jgi:hypothetical protein
LRFDECWNTRDPDYGDSERRGTLNHAKRVSRSWDIQAWMITIRVQTKGKTTFGRG